MTVYRLTEELIFPHPDEAEEDGLLAVGGDLRPERILLAYANGIFPWYSKGEPILWWSPDPRFVLMPDNIYISSSMKKILKKKKFEITINRCFREVMTQCGALREKSGTWINNEMIDAYERLHKMGYAHSVEAWHEGTLVGGLYGIIFGKCYFGESMFSIMDNSSKAAFITFALKLKELGIVFIDCQVYTKHLESLGAKSIPREEYLELLEKGLEI